MVTFISLKDRYASKLNRNKIFMGELDDKVLFGRNGDGMMKLIKGSLIIFKGVKKNGIYMANAEIVFENVVEVSSVEPDSSLNWHKILAHVSQRVLLFTQKMSFKKDIISKTHFL